jgi:serine/threonine-protein kinase
MSHGASRIPGPAAILAVATEGVGVNGDFGEEKPGLRPGGDVGATGETQAATLAADEGSSAGPVGRSDDELRRRNIRRAMRIGLIVWPAFALHDAYMCLALYPDAPFTLFLGYRVLVEGVLWLAYRRAMRPTASIQTLAHLQNLSFFLAAFCIALMGIHFGGTRSVYMHGISIVCLVRAAVIPEPWRRSARTFAGIGIVFPVVMGAVALFHAPLRAEWLDRTTLAVFGSNYVFVIATAVVGMWSGHAVWMAQQQVYRARRLGRYRLQAPIGKGGMGEVWLAWDQSLRRNVALKILRESGLPDIQSVQRFEREARSISRLRVPHTVQVYDFGASDDGIYYLAMEYLPGMDLYHLVSAHGPLPPARAVHFLLQTCESLEEAHALGIIHRDVKPQNLFVTRVGDEYDFVKLLDFGIARFQAGDGESGGLTRQGQMPGTPAYLAPELWQGAIANERTDVYALGATFYFLLTGTTPFRCEDLRDLMHEHLQVPPERPSRRCASPVPERIDEIVLRCLAKPPEERYGSVRDLREDLARARDPRGWTADDARAFWEQAAPGAALHP